jgi:hydroxymethylglutaryl-CoA lyase
MSTEVKKSWIKALADAGMREIEVGSFVPAKVLPQLADTGEIVAYARTIPGLTVAALVPNLRGAENAIAAGAQKITFPLSCSETHSTKNLRMTHAQAFEQVKGIVGLIRSLPPEKRPHFEGSLSTAFGCTLEGEVRLAKLLSIAETLMGLGCDEVGLADTAGYANPSQVKLTIKAIWDAVGKGALTGIHIHNTRGLGLANALAALDTGLTTFDSSLGGLGGCPFAPGASGNIVTEDLVFMFDAMGLKTGIDLAKLLKVREIVQAGLPAEHMYGFTPDAGLPLHYEQGGKGWGLVQA